jgi:predicted  nucleic acid-binding Zn-ribbon protein
MKWRCSVCGYIHDGDNPPEKCPKCGAPKEKFEKLTDDSARLIDKSRFTNMLHQKLAAALDEAVAICDKGIADNLDPGCADIFKKAKSEAFIINQMIKAEIQTHISKGKWG